MNWKLVAYYTIGDQVAAWQNKEFLSDTRRGCLDLFCGWIKDTIVDKVDIDIVQVSNG